MKLPKWVRISIWITVILLASVGVPLAGALPLHFKKDDESVFTSELVEDREDEANDSESKLPGN